MQDVKQRWISQVRPTVSKFDIMLGMQLRIPEIQMESYRAVLILGRTLVQQTRL